VGNDASLSILVGRRLVGVRAACEAPRRQGHRGLIEGSRLGEAGFIAPGVCRRALTVKLIECKNLGSRPLDLLDVEPEPLSAGLGLNFTQGGLAFNRLRGLVRELALKRGFAAARRLPGGSDGPADDMQQASNL